MKGDPIKPAPFVLGLCFICNKPCHESSYCHQECALAMAEERDKRKEQAKAMEKFT
jgi:hypothetical protein